MTVPADTHVLLRAFADELHRCGIAGVCTSPGSRSTPLVLALVRDGRIPAWSHIDERTAAFFALGAAKETGRPIALVCTSGTAAAHYLPAVIEAWEARVPLLLLTADRPPELREIGAGQAIDQLKLYGGHAKWFFEVGTHDASPERVRWMRTLACRACWTTLEGRPGPVHLNFSLREPLVLDAPLPEDEPGGGGRPGGAPWVARAGTIARAEPLPALAAARGIVVSGRHERDDGLPGAIDSFAAAAGWPVLADPLGGARRGPNAIAHYDALLRDASFAAGHRPELVLRVGDLPTSKPLRTWLAGLDARQLAVDPEGAWQDPAGVLSDVIRADPVPLLRDLAQAAGAAPAAWLDAWRSADARAAGAIAATLAGKLSEPAIAARLVARLPHEATLVVASSMAVRDVETFAAARDDPPRLLSNRGANGIDGTIATALGAAATAAGPVVVLLGDVALAHDLGALLAGKRLGLAITIVLLDNDGGGIFEFLPVASQRDVFEEHVATPSGLDVPKAAGLFGATYVPVADMPGFDAALDAGLNAGTTSMLHVRTDRAANVALHRDILSAVFAASP